MNLGNKWDEVLKAECERPYYGKLMDKVEAEYVSFKVCPPRGLLFAALETVDYDDVKAVILGQDPYHGEGQANGMAFAVNDGVDLPPSLKNIYCELESDLGVAPPKSGTLLGWAKQGVLLLNAVLSVRLGAAQSHSTLGWQAFTDAVISALSAREKPLAFVLWGSYAQSKRPLIASRHLIVASAHPSPLSAYRGFFGSKPFSKVNAFLNATGQTPIDWANVTGEKKASYYTYSKGGIFRV